MARNRMRLGVLWVFAWLALPAVANAQSAITGVVRDTSGAAMPGVTVEAASPVLIEKVKTTVTDGNGGYRINDLRPGLYTVTFTLTGFSTFRRDAVELPTDFTATINAELKVGALEETITVTGESPVVDVSSTSRVQVLSRDVLDAIPTGRTIYGMSQLVTGVALNQVDVGGSRSMQQTYMSTRGLTSANNIVQVDGLMINGLDGDGAVQQYINNQMIQEMTYTTAGAGADVSPGGVRVNVVMKDGGNSFNGAFFGAWNDGSWQSDNMSDALSSKGLRAVDKITKIYEFSVGLGGPILKDKLWYFAAGRLSGVDAPIADTFYVPPGATNADCQAGRVSCEQGIDDQNINSATLRLTWQISQRNKFSIYYEEIDKFRGHGMNAGDDPLHGVADLDFTPLQRRGAEVHQHDQQQAAVRRRLLLQLRGVRHHQPGRHQPGSRNTGVVRRRQPAGCDAGDAQERAGQLGWTVSRSLQHAGIDVVHHRCAQREGRLPVQLGRLRQHPRDQRRPPAGVPERRSVPGHGLQHSACATRRLCSGTSLCTRRTPGRFNRLTLNGGLRWETLRHEVSKQTSGAGRFIGERNFEPIPMPTWKDLSPRFGVVYDLFGNAKTALKFGLNRYNESRTTQFATRYNPLALDPRSISWTDTNGDDIAQGELGCTYLTSGCEINFAQLPANFGRAQLNRVDPNFKRVYNVETTAGVQHELFPRVSLSANWYLRTFHRLRLTDNVLRTMNDYIPFPIFNPMTGQAFTIYDVSPRRHQPCRPARHQRRFGP